MSKSRSRSGGDAAADGEETTFDVELLFDAAELLDDAGIKGAAALAVQTFAPSAS